MTAVQATVESWSETDGGTAVRDDGSRVRIPPEALRDSVFRFLRAGQRVSLVVEDGAVVRVHLV